MRLDSANAESAESQKRKEVAKRIECDRLLSLSYAGRGLKRQQAVALHTLRDVLHRRTYRARKSALDSSPPTLYPPDAVANSSKSAVLKDSGKAGSVPFEEALKKLESIVEAMESEELPLDTLLSKYEEGTRLAKACQEKLAEADLKIRQLEKTSAGEMKLTPMDVESED
jgi:exodeoxyribonuclease VII small subunit